MNARTTYSMAIAAGLAMSATAMADVTALGGTGITRSMAHDINDSGMIVGSSTAGINGRVATMWDLSGNRTVLGDARDYDFSTAYAINNNGTIVGFSERDGTFEKTATHWENGVIRDLGAEMRAQGDSVAWDINSSGTVVGQAPINAPGFAHGFVWDNVNGGVQAGTINMGGANLGINDAGFFVGHSFFFGDPNTAMVSMPDGRGGYQTIQLGPPGQVFSLATAVSNTGMIVGHTDFGAPEGSWQAAIFTTDLSGPPGPPMLLGTLTDLSISEANDVNDHGMIVGYSWDGVGTGEPNTAWAWVDGIMYDLNEELAPDSEFDHLLQATGVNNNGDIVGFGVLKTGQFAGFVIEGFVPAPGAMGMLAMGGLLAARRRR